MNHHPYHQYYDSIFAVAKNILMDAEPYMALKGHIQRVRHSDKRDPVPIPKEAELKQLAESNFIEDASKVAEMQASRLMSATLCAKKKIGLADAAGRTALEYLRERKHRLHASNHSDVCQHAVALYREAFRACAHVLELDELAFQVAWFKSFWCVCWN